MKYKIGFIGVGVMASTIIERMLQSNYFAANEICAFDISADRKQWLQEKNIYIPNNTNELADISQIVLLAIKPQSYEQILDAIDTKKIKALASIMAGVKINTLESKVGDIGIARIMPNAPAAIGEGVSAVCYNKMDKEDRDCINKMLAACGSVMELEESKFDAFTCICGSGPAYVYLILDAMTQAGVEGGLTHKEAKSMAALTLIGSAGLVMQTDTPFDTLIKNVCSKGGTTAQAISIFQEKRLKDILIQGINACRRRSIELSENKQ